MGRNKKKKYDDNELTPSSTIKNILIVQNEGKRQVSRNREHYSNCCKFYNSSKRKSEKAR